MQPETRNIIQFVSFPFIERDRRRFGIDYWRSRNFNVYVFDFTTVVMAHTNSKRTRVPDELEADFIHKIDSIEQFTRLVNMIGNGTVVIVYSYPSYRLEPFYRELRKRQIPILLADPGGYLPIKQRTMKGTVSRGFRFLLRNLRYPKYLLEKLNEKLAITKIPPPDKLFVSCAAAYRQYVKTFGYIDDRVVPTHMYDYDEYLNARAKNTDCKKYCVFIDENMGINHFEQVSGATITRINLNRYYASMRRFFDMVERKTGLEVIVAVSPRANYKESHRVFGRRRMVKGRTAEIVAQSRIMILHGSTAFSYAVLFKIPAIFVITEELLDRRKSNAVEYASALANTVNQQVINVDDAEAVSAIDFNNLSFNEQKYDIYRQEYISCNVDDDRTYWEIVEAAAFNRDESIHSYRSVCQGRL